MPSNIALSSNGAVAFAKDVIPGFPGTHNIPNLNDGLYGNGESWIGNSNPTFAGVRLAAPTLIDQIAFGRDSDGVVSFADRAAGAYILQYTTVANPSETTPDINWITLGSTTYDTADAQRFLRHLYSFEAVMATGVRILMNNGEAQIAIDEIEVFAAAVPEPGSIALWSVLGMIGAVVSWRKLRRKQ